MKAIFYFITLVLIFCGCATVSNFESIRNYDVGRDVNLVYASSPKIEAYNTTQDKYVYERNDGCKWAYYVNKKTKKVESWEYISSSDKCATGFNWFGPW